MPDSKKQQEMQQSLILLQLLQGRLDEMNQQNALIQGKVAEAGITHEGLTAMKDVAKQNDIIIPLGSGVFAHATLTEPKKIIMDVGAGVMVDMDLESAAKVLDERKTEIESIGKELEKESEEITLKINQLTQEIQSLQEGK